MEWRKSCSEEIIKSFADKLDYSFKVVKESSNEFPYIIYLKLEDQQVVECLVRRTNEKYHLDGHMDLFANMTLLLDHYSNIFVHEIENFESLSYFKGKATIQRLKDHLDISGDQFAVRMKRADDFSLVFSDGTVQRIKKVDGIYKADSFTGKTLDEVVQHLVEEQFMDD